MNDWRITDQKSYLLGKKLIKHKFIKTPKNDHEHCVFCWYKFLDGFEGYSTEDNYFWICEKCFNDFCDEFLWIL